MGEISQFLKTNSDFLKSTHIHVGLGFSFQAGALCPLPYPVLPPLVLLPLESPLEGEESEFIAGRDLGRLLGQILPIYGSYFTKKDR